MNICFLNHAYINFSGKCPPDFLSFIYFGHSTWCPYPWLQISHNHHFLSSTLHEPSLKFMPFLHDYLFHRHSTFLFLSISPLSFLPIYLSLYASSRSLLVLEKITIRTSRFLFIIFHHLYSFMLAIFDYIHGHQTSQFECYFLDFGEQELPRLPSLSFLLTLYPTGNTDLFLLHMLDFSCVGKTATKGH